MRRADDRAAGVADDGVETAEALDGEGDRRLDARRRADVELGVAAPQVAGDDRGALVAESFRDRGPDAGRAAGDERALPLQTAAQKTSRGRSNGSSASGASAPARSTPRSPRKTVTCR